MGFILLWDETGAIRLQKLLGYGEQKLAVGLDGMHTTIGGVPGKISAGNWKISLGIFEEYVKQNLEGKEATIEVVITDEISEITEPIGEHIWVEEGQVKISPQKYDWNKVYQREEKWYKGDFHTHTRLSDGKETVRHAMEKAKSYGIKRGVIYNDSKHHDIAMYDLNRQILEEDSSVIRIDSANMSEAVLRLVTKPNQRFLF